MNSAPWLTLIMPSYCGEQWIDASLQSIAMEPTTGIDVMLIDSSPTPATREIAWRYSQRLSLQIFERPDLTSWQSKTNFGVQAAKSSHVCWLGVDDLWFPGRALTVRHWIESAPNIPMHVAPSAIIDKRGNQLGVWHCPLPTQEELAWSFVARRLLVQNFIGAPAPVFRKDAWLACGGLDESLWYTADWDMWLKLAASGPIRYHAEVTNALRIHGGSLTATGSRDVADFADQMRIVVDRHLRRLPGESRSVERAARASIKVNAGLASAASGDFLGLARAVAAIVALGPAGMRRYFRDSRLIERVTPRVLARLAGAF